MYSYSSSITLFIHWHLTWHKNTWVTRTMLCIDLQMNNPPLNSFTVYISHKYSNFLKVFNSKFCLLQINKKCYINISFNHFKNSYFYLYYRCNYIQDFYLMGWYTTLNSRFERVFFITMNTVTCSATLETCCKCSVQIPVKNEWGL